MQEQDWLGIYQCISQQRLQKYHSKNKEYAIELYKWNMALSEALYPILSVMEIGLRNKLHVTISNYLNNAYWLSQKDNFICDRLHRDWLIKIDNNINDLRKRRIRSHKSLDNTYLEGKLIAEMSFGFWTVLLGGKFEYDKTIQKHLLWPALKEKVFPYAKGIHLDIIRKKLLDIKELRNRIFHHEPIWHWQNLAAKHDELIAVIKWIEPALLHLIARDRFSAVYKRRPHE